MTTTVGKVCHLCGTEVSSLLGHRDTTGHVLCERCANVRALGKTNYFPAQPGSSAPTSSCICTFCHHSISPYDVNYLRGDVACPACFQRKMIEEKSPTAPCEHCGGHFAASLITFFEGQNVCPECREELRIEFNLRAQARRTALLAGRPEFLAHRLVRYSTNPWSSVAGGLIALAFILWAIILLTH